MPVQGMGVDFDEHPHDKMNVLFSALNVHQLQQSPLRMLCKQIGTFQTSVLQLGVSLLQLLLVGPRDGELIGKWMHDQIDDQMIVSKLHFTCSGKGSFSTSPAPTGSCFESAQPCQIWQRWAAGASRTSCRAVKKAEQATAEQVGIGGLYSVAALSLHSGFQWNE